MSHPTKTRAYDATIEIAAAPEEVWKAIAEGEGLKNWFVFDARVTPGKGGNVFLSWGPGAEGNTPIEEWEPGKRLLTADFWPAKDGGEPPRIAVEYTLEAKGGKTILRLVNSGFDTDASWDNEFESLTRGWNAFLTTLRHYVERHSGSPRIVTYAEARPDGTTAESWERLMGADGFRAVAALGGAREGERLAFTSADGDALAGRALVLGAPKSLAMVVEGWNDAHLWVECYGRVKGGSVVKLTLSTWGVPARATEEIGTRWTAMLARLFPAKVPAG